jgi:hypothetical protein
MRWLKLALLTLLPLLSGCPFPAPAPRPLNIYYFPENPAMCPEGVRTEVRMVSNDDGYFFGRLLFYPGNYREHNVEEVPAEWEPDPRVEGGYSAVRFQMSRPTTSPLRGEVLDLPLPPQEEWRGFYQLRNMPRISGARLPTLKLQCGDAPLLEYASQPGKLVFVILEDATAPSKLRVLQYGFPDFGP